MQDAGPDTADLRRIAELRDLILGGERAAMIHAIVRCGIPDHLADGALSIDDLAERSGTLPGLLGRLLRALAPSGLVTETSDGKWELTELGAWLRPNHPGSMHPLAIYAGEPWMRAAWDHLEHGLRTGGVPFETAHGTPFFEYLDRHPEARRVFDSVMATYQKQRLAIIAASYDWSRFGHVVDVGGGHGILLFSLLHAYPSVRGTVFDLPEVAAIARRHAVWEGLAERLDVVAGNFFDDTPPPGDALVLSRILHDWPDEACICILRRCRAAMETSAELLILERVIEEGDEQRADKEADIHIHVVLGGKERTRIEFAQLLAAAGFVLERVVATTTTNQIVVGRPA